MNKIMFVIPSIRNGGAERVITRLSTGLIEAGYEIHIMEFFRPVQGYTLDSRVQLHSMFETEVEYDKTSFLMRNKMMRQEILSIKPDAIIPFLEYVCQKTQLSLLFTKYFKRIVVTLRNSPTVGKRKDKFLRLLSIWMSNSCIAQSKRQAGYLPGWLQHKIFAIANPIEYVEEPFCEKSKEIRFIAAGRLVEQKNYAFMISSFAKVAKHRNVYLDIFGVGEQKMQLSKMIDDLKLSEKITLRDYSQNLIEEYRKSSIYILTSNWEGMPNALLEAMALGMPCIATDCPTGPAELISDKKYGILVPMNDEEALVGVMIRLIDDPELRKELGHAAREHILGEYSLSRITAQWIEILQKRGLVQ